MRVCHHQVCGEPSFLPCSHAHALTPTLTPAATVFTPGATHWLPSLWASGYLLAVAAVGGRNAASDLLLAAICILSPYRVPACLPRDLSRGPGCWNHSAGWGPLGLAFVSGAGLRVWQEAWTGLGRGAPHW